MKFHELESPAKPRNTRVGRGISAGQGKTAGRGTKGQNSRAGSSKKPGFEGGQTALMQRLPKLRGFRSHRPKTENVLTGQLSDLGITINNSVLAKAGLVSSAHVKVKLLGGGEVTKKHNVKLQAASAGAIAQIKKKGGTFDAVGQVGREPKSREISEKK